MNIYAYWRRMTTKEWIAESLCPWISGQYEPKNENMGRFFCFMGYMIQQIEHRNQEDFWFAQFRSFLGLAKISKILVSKQFANTLLMLVF
ncbi:MAG: hypothetical protein KR126chlam3_00206 [Chlamydiae bacterium]|nr:hypothetical protein [Chlamydiota bacterium]